MLLSDLELSIEDANSEEFEEGFALRADLSLLLRVALVFPRRDFFEDLVGRSEEFRNLGCIWFVSVRLF